MKQVADQSRAAMQHGELDRDRRDMLKQLQGLDAYRRECRLIEMQSPGQHWTTAGLAATRAFAALMRQPR